MATNSRMDECAPSTSRGSGDVAVKVKEEPPETLTVRYFDLVPPIPDAERLAAEVKVEPEDGAAMTDQLSIEVKKEIKQEPRTSGNEVNYYKRANKGKGRKKAGDKRSYECHLCKRRHFRSLLGLEEHIRTHVDERPFRCNICGKSFKLKGNLVSHFKTHSDERPFGCSHCAMQFKRKQTLQWHMRTHTGDKPYQCERCRKCFTVYSTLKHHLATHSDEKPFSCDFCSKKFKWKENFKRHSNMHPDQFPFECSNHNCDRRFAGEDKKTAHEQKCKKFEPKHNCAICGKSLKTKWDLRRHSLVHSTEKNFKCQFCPKAFKTKTNLNQHSKQHKNETLFRLIQTFKRDGIRSKPLQLTSIHEGKSSQ